jgi:glutamine cyclotransferase
VLNGIAYDPAGERLFVTGKLWPTVFEIEIVGDEANVFLPLLARQ